MGDATDDPHYSGRANLFGTDSTDWLGLALGFAFEFNDLAFTFEVPWVWAATKNTLQADTSGLTNGQLTLAFNVMIGFKLD